MTHCDLKEAPRRIAQLSPFQAILSVVKCAIGAGSFTLPRVFFDASIALAVVLTVFIGSVCCFTAIMLHRVDWLLCRGKTRNFEPRIKEPSKRYSKIEMADFQEETCTRSNDPGTIDKNFPKPPEMASFQSSGQLTFPELGELSFPKLEIRFLGGRFNVMNAVIFSSIVMTSIGVCSAYVDFISGTLPEVVANWSPSLRLVVTPTSTPFLLLPVLFLLSLLKDFKSMLWVSIIGDVAVLCGCVTVIVYGAIHYSPGIEGDLAASFQPEGVPTFLGSSTFLFAVHVVVFPIIQQTGSRIEGDSLSEECVDAVSESNLQSRESVTRWAYGFLILFNICFGTIGCFLYQHVTCFDDPMGVEPGPCANVLSNIQAGGTLDLVKAFICVDLLMSIPIVLTAGREIIELALRNSWRSLQGPHRGLAKTSYYNRNLQCEEEDQTEKLNDVCNNIAPEVACNPLNPLETIVLSGEQKSLPVSTVLKPSQPEAGKLGFAKTIFSFLSRSLLRFALVSLVILLATSIPRFNELITLVGGVICSITGFVIPPVLYIRARFLFDETPPSSLEIVGLAAVSVLGVLVAASALWMSIK